jgi:hypothetical protein
MFHLIIIVAFIHPLSSLLVNIISATGNSKAFLKLEVIKKGFFTLSLAIGFIWGIEGFLICNAIAYILAVYVNVFFASRELQVKQAWFLRITFPYIMLTTILAGTFGILQHYLNFPHITHLIFSCILFSLIFGLSAWLLNLEGFNILRKEIKISEKVKNYFDFDKNINNTP